MKRITAITLLLFTTTIFSQKEYKQSLMFYAGTTLEKDFSLKLTMNNLYKDRLGFYLASFGSGFIDLEDEGVNFSSISSTRTELLNSREERFAVVVGVTYSLLKDLRANVGIGWLGERTVDSFIRFHDFDHVSDETSTFEEVHSRTNKIAYDLGLEYQFLNLNGFALGVSTGHSRVLGFYGLIGIGLTLDAL